MANGRAFEDVVFAAILGVWSIKVKALWEDPVTFRRPLLFLVVAGLVAIILRLLWEIPSFGLRLWGFGWAVVAFGLIAGGGVWTQFFSYAEGVTFWFVLVVWGLTAIFADWAGRQVNRALGA